tara:strand:- start:34234 stop:35343 length:1110 start_codon:yes stop_codon:yes gene_type:complete
MNSRIHYTKPSITELEIRNAKDAATHGWGEHCYEYINQFEKLFGEYLDVPHVIATSSCTGALHMGMSALGIGEGDEVILADTNWIATAAPIVHLGATPVFVDILSDSWCIDPAMVERAITPRTKAIIATHLYGNLCDMNRLLEIGEQYSIPVIEDAAEAVGSEYHGKKAGSMGVFGTFSFHGTKTLTTGEGGAFVTSDVELFENVLTLSNHGRTRNQSKQFWPDVIGFKYKMSNIQAAIGCAQLERVAELVKRKREILNIYKTNLCSLSGITMNPEPQGTINGAWMPTVVFSHEINMTSEKIQKLLVEQNIDARVFFWPLSMLPMFDAVEENKNAYDIPARSINLPSYNDIREEDILRVCTLIKSAIND